MLLCYTHMYKRAKTSVYVSSAELCCCSCTVLYVDSVLRWMPVRTSTCVRLTPGAVLRELLVYLVVFRCFRVQVGLWLLKVDGLHLSTDGI